MSRWHVVENSVIGVVSLSGDGFVEPAERGLISGGVTPICSPYKRGETPVKDYWSDGTKNSRSHQARPRTAVGVRPRRCAQGSDEAVLGPRLSTLVVRRSDPCHVNQRVAPLQFLPPHSVS